MSDLEAEASPEASHGSDVFGLPRSEVRRRSLAGVFYLTASSFANLLIGFFASLVLARMLTPSDFGVVAIGSTATLIGGALADGGLGAGMIRRPQPPTRSELRTLNGIQLALALAFCLPAAVIALGFGRTGAVTAIMIVSIPITMLQTPGRIMLYRDMRYDRQLAIDFSAQTSFQIFSRGHCCPWSRCLGACHRIDSQGRRGDAIDSCAQHRLQCALAARLAGVRRAGSIRVELPGELVYVGRA